MRLFRYSRWDGSMEPFPFHEDDILDQVSEQILTQGDVSSALRSLVQRGFRGRSGGRLPGVQEMLQRLRGRRQELLDRYSLDTVLDDLARQLKEIVDQERAGIDRRLEEVQARLRARTQDSQEPSLEEEMGRRLQLLAQKSREFLDSLPQDLAGQVSQLQGYEFMDQEARSRFDALLGSLRQRVADSYFKGVGQALTPEALKAVKEMLRDLNRQIEQRLQGRDGDFSSFMSKWGHLFGRQRPSSLDEMADGLNRQMAIMESLLQSLSPEQRQQLQAMTDSLFRDPELRQEISRFVANLEALHPMKGLRRTYPFHGEDGLALDEAVSLVERLQRMEDLERQLRRTQQGAGLEDVDLELVRSLLGDETEHEMAQLKRLTEVLEEAGYVKRIGMRLELTPLAMRKIGQKALREIFLYIKSERPGDHTVTGAGPGVERGEGTKPYQYGDSFDLDLHQTLMSAVSRGREIPLRLEAGDFQVYVKEKLNQASTVLMIDLSLSMAMRGSFLAAKKVALALDNLIRTQFPRDMLYIVGFSTYAREVKAEKLPYLSWDEFDPYTNIQHGLATAQKLLSRCSGGTRQILMISDGEPTAHIEGGQLFLQYPPSPRTIRETLREVKRCTSKGIIINIFMLDRNSYLVEFVDQMTRLNGGRVFYTSPERLGEYVLVDYCRNRRRVFN
ncbi:MAG: VWA domain-containing protein [Chloroflexi bacterium]|nr:VWA domain-containing protein [Chloroflexota bacterium]